jgi:hypothetical protein
MTAAAVGGQGVPVRDGRVSAGSTPGSGDGSAPPVLLVLAASVLGALLGALLGAAQASVLPGHVRHPWRWAGTSAVVWAPAMAVIFLGVTAPGTDWSGPTMAAHRFRRVTATIVAATGILEAALTEHLTIDQIKQPFLIRWSRAVLPARWTQQLPCQCCRRLRSLVRSLPNRSHMVRAFSSGFAIAVWSSWAMAGLGERD